MKKDVKIINDYCNFKERVNGIVIVDDKLLAVEMNDNGSYCLPGGHVELNEDSRVAVAREMQEEVECSFVVKDLVAVIENFFTNHRKNQRVHEVSFYYITEPDKNIRLEDYTVIEHEVDKDIKLAFKWIPLKEIEKYNFQPKLLGKKLSEKRFDLEHFIIND